MKSFFRIWIELRQAKHQFTGFCISMNMDANMDTCMKISMNMKINLMMKWESGNLLGGGGTFIEGRPCMLNVFCALMMISMIMIRMMTRTA